MLNLITGGSILVLNIAFVPFMIRAFGMELYGVLAVTWLVLGHLRWLDLGFSAACARYVAQDIALGRGDQAGHWAWTAIAAQAVIGAIAGVALWGAAPALVDLLRIDPETRSLVVLALRLFALVVPLELATRSLVGVLEGTQRFDWINGLNAFGAVWTLGVYTLGIVRGGDFHAVVYGLVALKVVLLAATFAAAVRVVPGVASLSNLRFGLILDPLRLLEMIRFGGWVSVSVAIAPAIAFFDRWVIGGVEGVARLPFYTVPFNFLLALALIPGSLASSLFPAFSAMEAHTRWDRLEGFFIQAHRYLLLVIPPLFFVLFLWAEEILRLWIGAQFAAEAATPFRILTLGFAAGYLAPLSGALLQGVGRPDILAKVYLAEFPCNVVVTWWLVSWYGITGAALAFALRSIVETTVLLVAVHWTFPLSARRLARQVLRPAMVLLPVGLAGIVYLLPAVHLDSLLALGVTGGVLVVYAGVANAFLLNATDRAFFRRMLGRLGT